MATSTSLLPLLLICSTMITRTANGQLSPGHYYPSSKIKSTGFRSYFSNLWGPRHQSLSSDGSSLTIWLDKSSGSGFKSRKPYRDGYFGVSMKLQGGYTAGVIASFYLSNNQARPGHHDEVDVEFLGTIPGKPYVLQTNVYVKGSGDGNHLVGREMRFHLWFDPTASFHHYAISWNRHQILFFVDNVPIRQYLRKSSATYPERPMWVYGSIWDASDWATEGGLYKVDYHYQPFVAHYTHFKISGCSTNAPPPSCQPSSLSSSGSGLSTKQIASMKRVQSKYMIYNYCKDSNKDRSLTPECRV